MACCRCGRGCCAFGGCLCGFFCGSVLTAMMSMAVGVSLLAAVIPLQTFVEHHKEVFSEAWSCAQKSTEEINETLHDEVPEKCWEIMQDRCDGDPESYDQACDTCQCQVAFALSKLSPPLQKRYLKCCQPFAKDKGTAFLVDACEGTVKSLAQVVQNATEACEAHGVTHHGEATIPLLLAFAKGDPTRLWTAFKGKTGGLGLAAKVSVLFGVLCAALLVFDRVFAPRRRIARGGLREPLVAER
mmetsp:Transcript_20244/g.47952  ORF Transcript_20244/g.47952 Transcript_20244/m.47952 type:complete len:243 (-) Transcript_20244:61-789(-)